MIWVESLRFTLVKYCYYGKGKSKKPLTIDGKKALWIMRMIVGEGGRQCSERKAKTLIWAIVNRWFLWKGSRHYLTFVGLMRAFSQPINPRWMTGGDLAKKYVGRSPASASRLKRRAKICNLNKSQIPRRIKKAVSDFANGKVPFEFEQRISNWASLKSTPGKFPWGFYIDDDWFFEDKNLKDGSVAISQ